MYNVFLEDKGHDTKLIYSGRNFAVVLRWCLKQAVTSEQTLLVRRGEVVIAVRYGLLDRMVVRKGL